MASMPYICASGSPRDVGRQVGEAARELVEASLACYREQYPVLAGQTFEETVAASRGHLGITTRVPAVVDSLEQLRGLAEGAAVPFAELFALNCSEEYTCLPDAPEQTGHCTSFAFLREGRVVAGHNEDWYPADIPCLVMRDLTVGGTRVLTVGPAAYLPITGLNSWGLCCSANTVYSWDVRDGVPNNLLLNALLFQPDIQSAVDCIARVPRARGSNHLLCDARGRIVDVETTATRLARVDGGALFVHTNHYVSEELAPQDATQSEGTFRRRSRAERLLVDGLAAGRGPVGLAQSVLRDHADAPFSICGHWDDEDESLDQSVTTASLVWEPGEGRAHVAIGPPCEHDYVTYSL